MKLSDFDYQFDERLIANEPVYPREAAKLMVYDRNAGLVQHKRIGDLLEVVTDNDVMVFNKTKVSPVRLFASKKTGGKVEVFLVKPRGDGIWEALCKPGQKTGQELSIEGRMMKVTGREEEIHLVEADLDESFLLRYGRTPLPPYIKCDADEEKLRRDYQTIYAERSGSVAAPTAGLHFSEEMMLALRAKGVQIEFVNLTVGLGTFASVKNEDLEKHRMHSEDFELAKEVAERLDLAKRNGKRIIAIGTTTVRVLESCVTNGRLHEKTGRTKIFIYPPYKFNFVDALITNFHLPKSTLVMLVSAFCSCPNVRENFVTFGSSGIGRAYEEAVKKRYRFFSFGDAMLIS